MSKQVVIIASGPTERAAIPLLVRDLQKENINVNVQIPPRHGKLTVDAAERLLKSAWYRPQGDSSPNKYVILVDVDGKQPDAVLEPFRQNLASRLEPQITASLQFAYAQWHLEAWFFGDSDGLRAYLGRDLGSVDSSQPDNIENPKLHLKNLLTESYTRLTSETIASLLDPQIIAGRSPSFHGFIEAVRNGDG